MMIPVFERVENILGKGENAGKREVAEEKRQQTTDGLFIYFNIMQISFMLK